MFYEAIFETDEELRARIHYVADKTKRSVVATGEELDDIAALLGLKRRIK